MSVNRNGHDAKETHRHGPFPATLARNNVPVVHGRKEYIQGICTSGDMHDVGKDGSALLNHSGVGPVNHGLGKRKVREEEVAREERIIKRG
jgi:hypothetical protein